MIYECDKGIKRYKKCLLSLAYKILCGSSWLYDGLSLELDTTSLGYPGLACASVQLLREKGSLSTSDRNTAGLAERMVSPCSAAQASPAHNAQQCLNKKYIAK